MRYQCLGLCVSMLICNSGAAIAQSNFEDYKLSADSAFQQYSSEVQIALDEFIERQDLLFKEYSKRIYEVWGDTVIPPQHLYYEFTDNYRSKVEIDFERGKVEAAIVIDETADRSKIDQAKKQLQQKLKESVTTPGRKDVLSSDGEIERDALPILKDQVTDMDGKLVTPEDADRFAGEVIQQGGIERTEIVGGDGRRRIRLSARYALMPDHLMIRAKRFLPIVIEFSDKYDVDPRLVMAIIHTESYFNPRAVSYVPAFGLMQIVPATGGMEASRKVFGSARLLNPEYLYDPRNNIMMGCAYLNVIRYEYLADVKPDQIAYPPMIASYNGGIGSVCRALTGGNELSQIPVALNPVDFAEVVDVLKQRLPAQETRDYLVNVLKRMEFYDSIADR